MVNLNHAWHWMVPQYGERDWDCLICESWADILQENQLQTTKAVDKQTNTKYDCGAQQKWNAHSYREMFRPKSCFIPKISVSFPTWRTLHFVSFLNVAFVMIFCGIPCFQFPKWLGSLSKTAFLIVLTYTIKWRPDNTQEVFLATIPQKVEQCWLCGYRIMLDFMGIKWWTKKDRANKNKIHAAWSNEDMKSATKGKIAEELTPEIKSWKNDIIINCKILLHELVNKQIN